ncbi:hypothetical protein B0H21DRAFT_767970 [Amylocystis lapponica]|nr:hypothetical protein B0H21DRAFT_767970 [Amylocystis lapponica]
MVSQAGRTCSVRWMKLATSSCQVRGTKELGNGDGENTTTRHFITLDPIRNQCIDNINADMTVPDTKAERSDTVRVNAYSMVVQTHAIYPSEESEAGDIKSKQSILLASIFFDRSAERPFISVRHWQITASACCFRRPDWLTPPSRWYALMWVWTLRGVGSTIIVLQMAPLGSTQRQMWSMGCGAAAAGAGPRTTLGGFSGTFGSSTGAGAYTHEGCSKDLQQMV